jgi:CRP-like cAMP-binding protein
VIGREGFTGSSTLLGADRTPLGVVVHLEYATALCVETACLTEATDRFPEFRSILLRYVQTLLVQASGNVRSKVFDRLEARLSRWLLMWHDRMDGDEMPLTHELISNMLGAPRTAVTAAIHELEGLGALRGRRGRILIRDRATLHSRAGGSYGASEAEYERIIGRSEKAFLFSPRLRLSTKPVASVRQGRAL